MQLLVDVDRERLFLRQNIMHMLVVLFHAGSLQTLTLGLGRVAGNLHPDKMAKGYIAVYSVVELVLGFQLFTRL